MIKFMKPDKQKLEQLISEERTLGNYVFDEEKLCFYGDAEIVLGIAPVEAKKYKSICYFFDGYEVWLDDEEAEFYEGSEEDAKRLAIESFNREKFMDYPIIYTNVFCEIYEDE